MSRPLIINPAFATPLNAQQLHDLGVIAIAWGQVDFLVDQILSYVFEFDREQMAQFIGEKPIGGKVDMLKRHAKRLPSEMQPLIANLIIKINQLKTRRNACFHGVWGWRVEKKGTRQPAVKYDLLSSNPVRATDLRKIAEECMACSRVAGEALGILQGLPFKPAAQFLWPADPSVEPKQAPGLSGGEWRKARSPRDRSPLGPHTPPKAEPPSEEE